MRALTLEEMTQVDGGVGFKASGGAGIGQGAGGSAGLPGAISGLAAGSGTTIHVAVGSARSGLRWPLFICHAPDRPPGNELINSLTGFLRTSI